MLRFTRSPVPVPQSHYWLSLISFVNHKGPFLRIRNPSWKWSSTTTVPNLDNNNPHSQISPFHFPYPVNSHTKRGQKKKKERKERCLAPCSLSFSSPNLHFRYTVTPIQPQSNKLKNTKKKKKKKPSKFLSITPLLHLNKIHQGYH